MLVVLSSATGQPITVEEVKQQLRIESTLDDQLIESYIDISRRLLENKLGRTLLPTQYKLIRSNFPGSTHPIELPKPPLLSSTGTTSADATSTSLSIMFYKDSTITNDAIYMSVTAYALDTGELMPKVYPIRDNEWPSSYTTDKKDAVQITYWAGYPSRDKVPEPLKHWMKMKVGALYEIREAFSMRDFNPNRLEHEFFDGLLDPYIVIKVL